MANNDTKIEEQGGMSEEEMSEGPGSSKGYLCVLGLVAVATAPWPFIGQPTRFAFGLPLWFWWSFGMSAVLSVVTAYGILRYWPGDEHD